MIYFVLQPEAGLKIHVDIQCTYRDNKIKTKMSCHIIIIVVVLTCY